MTEDTYLQLTALGMAQALRPALGELVIKLEVLGIDAEVLQAAVRELYALTAEGSSLIPEVVE